MHAAPSVSYPVGRCRFAGALLALLWLVALAGLLAWSSQAAAAAWLRVAAFALLAGCGAWAALAWRLSPTGTLAWDGAGWRWQQAALDRAGQPRLALDLQSRLLLRWQEEGGAVRWLWLERDAAPAHWDALRRAVYSRATDKAPHGATPPVA
jgi:toxin CptA